MYLQTNNSLQSSVIWFEHIINLLTRYSV